MTGLLRIVGLMNAAVWLGSTAFFAVVAAPTLLSTDMKHLLGENNYPFFANAIVHLLAKRFFALQIICASIALLHILAEWLYLGRRLRRLNTSLTCGLFGLALASALLIGPKIDQLHKAKFAPNQPPEIVSALAKSLQLWHGLGQLTILLMLAGLIVYFWRLASPASTISTARFVPPIKLGI